MKPAARFLLTLLTLGLAAATLALLPGCRSGKGFDIRKESRQILSDMASISNRIDPSFLRPPTEPFQLGPGDVIEIEILGRTGSRSQTFLGPDGRIYYDLVSGLDLWGLTPAEARTALEQDLGKFYHQPRVALSVKEVQSRRVWVVGRLNKTGVFPLAAPMTVIEAISLAGGLFTSRFTGSTEELADLEHSFLIRKGELVPINFQRLLRQGDTTQNVYLKPDDFIYLPSALSKEIYVIGAVRAPRPLGYTDFMTLTTAIAKSLGPTPEAHLLQVVIVRGSLSEPKIALVNYRAIMTGQVPDIQLQPRDIVYVPDKPYGTLERYANMAVNTFVRTAAGNEGGRAGAGGFNNITPVNPIVIP
jgi:polysaccharide export outer membrane protein